MKKKSVKHLDAWIKRWGRSLFLLSVLLIFVSCSGVTEKKKTVPVFAAQQEYVYALTNTDFSVYSVPLVSGNVPFYRRTLQTSIRPSMISRAGGGVYLAMDGTIAAWSQGKQMWTSEIGEEIQTMAATAQDVYVVTSQQVMAIDATTGKLMWQEMYPFGGIFASHIFAITFFHMLVVAQGEDVHVFDVSTGQTRWTMLLPTAGDGEVITAITGTTTTIVLCTGTAMVAVNAVTGQLRWQQDDQVLLSAVSADGTMLYVPFFETPRFSSENGRESHTQTGIEAVNVISGAVRWSDVFALKTTEIGTVTNQYLSWISTDGTMSTWRLSDGQQLWHTARHGHPVALTVDLFDQSVVVQDNQGEVDSLALFNGGIQWSHADSVKGLSTAMIQIDTHAIYVLDENILHAFPRSGGRDIWSLILPTSTQWNIESFAR